jgi:hypothetical protein
MKQSFILLFFVNSFISCTTTKKLTQKDLVGAWDNKNGQILVFHPSKQALWVFYSEAKRDTFNITYRTDFLKEPKYLDLTDFKTGPLKGGTLYGIVEFEKDHSFRFDCEPSQKNRPMTFASRQTQRYYRLK